MPIHYNNCLYVHGLHSHVNMEKVDIMTKYFNKVTARDMNYAQTHDAFTVIRDLCLSEKVDFIVGSSFGGYLGFYLSRELQLPAILFNPALVFKKQDETYIQNESQLPSPFSLFVVGEQDDVIPPLSTDLFIKENEVRDNINVVKCSWLGHRIDLDTFDSMIASGVRLSLK